MASNKVLKVALGKSEVDEQAEGLHRLSEHVSGNVGLFFTSLPRNEVDQLFSKFQVLAHDTGPLLRSQNASGRRACCTTPSRAVL